jgi:sugar phosphate isomerase/epimerase
MITLSAFADEIDPSLDVQMDVCAANGVRCIDVRNIDRKNVSAMTLDEVRAYRAKLDARGFRVPCIGSPIGKIRVDEPMAPHLDLLKRCCETAHAFGTDLIRVFSFYGPKGSSVDEHRSEVMDRMNAMIRVAQSCGVVLMHENESEIFGRTPANVLDMVRTLKSDSIKWIFDPANFVTEKIKPHDEGWAAGLCDHTDYFHIKDKVLGARCCVPAGEGDGQIPQIIADLKKRSWSGYMTLEPHMKAAEQFAGFTGPDLFGKAVSALKSQLTKAGLAVA